MRRLRTVFIFLLAFMMCFSCGITAFASGGDPADYEAIDRQLAADVEAYHIPAMAVAVVDKDGVLFEGTYGECESADRPFIIGSMSKSFTALAIMQLAEQGSIDLDSPMDKYIDPSEWFVSGTGFSRITVRDLLNQTSGIKAYAAFGSLESTDSYGSHIYANANYGLLGLIVEAVSGMTYEQYVTRYIFEPLSMTHSAASLEKSRENGLIKGYRNYFGIPVAGEPDYPADIHKGTWTNVPAGYLSASVSDMERYLQMYLRGGEDIIGSESVNAMFYDNVPAGGGEYYGFGWTYTPDMEGQPVINHAGLVENYTSNMFILPEKGIGVVVLVSMNDYLVGNTLLGNIVMPLLGGQRQETPNMYLILHAAIDAAYILLFFISIYSVCTLKKWREKAGRKATFAADILRHIVLPAVLLTALPLMGTPYRILWLFVKDMTIVIFANALILVSAGVYKIIKDPSTNPSHTH